MHMDKTIQVDSVRKGKVFFMDELNKVIKNIISISSLSRGQASKLIQKIKEEKSHYIIVKNNKPQAVIMSIDEYSETVEELKNYEKLKSELVDSYLLDIAEKRMSTLDKSKLISSKDIISKYNLNNDRINELSETIEIE